MEIGDHIILKINGIAFNGKGFGTYYDKDEEYEYKVLVPYAVPGEFCRVKITKNEGPLLEAEKKDILTESKHRRESKCPYFKECGACSMMHINYDQQLKVKQGVIEHLLKKNVDDILPSNEYNYRIRSRFKVQVVNGKAKIGFFKKKKHQIVEITKCHLVHPMINKTLETLRNFFSNNIVELYDFEIEIHAKENNNMVLVSIISPNNMLDYSWELLKKYYQEYKHFVKGIAVFGTKGLYKSSEKINSMYTISSPFDINYTYRLGSFTQVNLEQNKTLIECVYSFANLKGEENILDLYCGIGNFSFSLAKKCKYVYGIEGNPQAIKDATANQILNKIDNCSFECSDCEKAISKLIQGGKKYDLIIVDPPREGLGNLANSLKYLSDKIIYISCHPQSLAKDIKKIGYKIKRIQPIDMFPQTIHVETVVLLEKI